MNIKYFEVWIMKLIEYGKENSRTVLLLHGGGLGWWSYRAIAEALAKDFRVVIPTLDGHGGADRPFVSIEENAVEIIDYIDREHSGKVDFIGGLSLGGQILCEMLSLRPDICDAAIIESASVIPSPKWISSLIKPTMDMSYSLISKKWFAKWQFKYLHIREDLFTEYFKDTVKIAKDDMTAFLKASIEYGLKPSMSETRAKVKVTAGGKEQRDIIRSAEVIRDAIPGSELVIKNGLYHGEWSINHPDDYAATVRKMLS
jgi:pimeloyl-ACP methyl ester carboxylesterase